MNHLYIKIGILFLCAFILIFAAGCGNTQNQNNTSAIATESANDAQVDFPALQAENPDIFAWIYIPGTTIDYPVLQNAQSDNFYADHNAYGQKNTDGAVYIELANLTTMCDFNTVLHGNTGEDKSAPFAELYQFMDPVFFDEHENIYLYLDGNVLTYEIFAAYERENTSLIRTYDFTYYSGCKQFLDDLYAIRDINMNLRNNWAFVNPYHFLITLTTQENENDDKQLVIVAVLIKDAAGTVSRIIEE